MQTDYNRKRVYCKTAKMASITSETKWGDFMVNQPASPPPKEKGWTAVHAPKKSRNNQPKATDNSVASDTAKKLNFDEEYKANLKKNKFSALVESDSE